jgi:hypothetical protein
MPGREISILLEPEWMDRGTHEVVVDAGDLPSGACIYRLTGENEAVDGAGRMLIVK